VWRGVAVLVAVGPTPEFAPALAGVDVAGWTGFTPTGVGVSAEAETPAGDAHSGCETVSQF
jgi:hypothetical protein